MKEVYNTPEVIKNMALFAQALLIIITIPFIADFIERIFRFGKYKKK